MFAERCDQISTNETNTQAKICECASPRRVMNNGSERTVFRRDGAICDDALVVYCNCRDETIFANRPGKYRATVCAEHNSKVLRVEPQRSFEGFLHVVDGVLESQVHVTVGLKQKAKQRLRISFLSCSLLVLTVAKSLCCNKQTLQKFSWKRKGFSSATTSDPANRFLHQIIHATISQRKDQSDD